MLGNYEDHRRVFIEVTKTEHDHGGPGWEFGTCLWSPSLNKAGHDSYSLMREVAADDFVIHILEDEWDPGRREHRIVGRSYAQAALESREDQPPNPGQWANQAPYFRIPLRDYEPFPAPISLAAFFPLYEEELREQITAGHLYYPFILYDNGRRLQLRQGGYINRCPPELFDLVKRANGETAAAPGDPLSSPVAPLPSADREYKETKRLASERLAFARDPALIRNARAIRGYQCEACDFDFEARYGTIGHQYIECHHVDPLGERETPTALTKVRDVRMLCANCHRMVHRTRPPLPVEELREALGLPVRPPTPDLDS